MECPGCGAPVGESDTTCGSCGEAIPIADAKPQSTGERGWGTDTDSFECETCGAETVYSAKDMTVRCPYCGSEKVIKHEPKAGEEDTTVRPEYVIPFAIEESKSRELFDGWLKSLWFAPGDLAQMADPERMRGVYLPFWAYDVKTNTYYRGQVGFNYQEQVQKTRTNAEGEVEHYTTTETRTRWESCSGWNSSEYDDVLVCASKGVDRGLVKAIEPFRMEDRKPYDANYLKGWEAEKYSIDEDMAWKSFGRDEVRAQEEDRCEQKAKRSRGADKANVSCDIRFEELKSRHMLLPVYVSAFNYHDKVYRFLVNGQTGEVQGQRPWSALKIGILVGVIVGIILCIVLAVSFSK